MSIARANSAPLLRKNAAASEANRRVEEETIQAMKKAGLMRVCTPKRYGGWEMNTRAMLDVSSAIAEGDGAAAWVANLNNVCCWLTSLFSRKAQDEVFGADPDTCVSGVLNPTATVKKEPAVTASSGTWHYNSGGWHAQWAVLGLPLVNDAGEMIDQGLAMIPMADLEREDTWFVAGMKATGSIALHAKNVFIPDHRILSVPQAIEGKYPTEMHRRDVLPLGVCRASLHHPGRADPRIGPCRAGIRSAKCPRGRSLIRFSRSKPRRLRFSFNCRMRR